MPVLGARAGRIIWVTIASYDMIGQMVSLTDHSKVTLVIQMLSEILVPMHAVSMKIHAGAVNRC